MHVIDVFHAITCQVQCKLYRITFIMNHLHQNHNIYMFTCIYRINFGE